MTFWQEFALIFTEMGVLPAICIIVGLALVVTEMFIPGFGFPGISGTILLIAGIVIRVVNAGKGNPVIQFFVLLTIILLLLGIAFIIMLESVKRGWLSKTSIVERSTAVDIEHSAGTNDFRELVGKVGITVTALRPTGMVSIEGKNYDATAVSTFVDKDVLIEVDSVEGVKINVRIKGDDDAQSNDNELTKQ